MKLLQRDRFDRLPDAIFFDVDNTLYAYDPAHAAAMTAARIKTVAHLAVSSEDFDKTFDRARSEVKARLTHTAASHSRLLYFQRMFELFGVGSQVLMALDLEQTYWRTFLATAELFEGVRDFLDDLRLLSIPTVIVTDLTAQIQFRKIAYWGLDHYFDFVVTSEEAGVDKPAAAPFRLAREKLQTEGDRIWMIGDSPAKDIAGARDEIGAVTLQKKHDGIVVGSGDTAPDAVFTEFAELRRLLESVQDV